MSDEIFLAGASVRSVAQSARRAGLQVHAADLFDDLDLAGCQTTNRISDYPRGLLPVAERLPAMEWMYTGGLENDPELVDAISRRHTLLGNPGSVLRNVRDPWVLFRTLHDAQLLCPEPHILPPGNDRSRWLAKPIKSCGGHHIRALEPGSGPPEAAGATSADVAAVPLAGWYYQRLIAGRPFSATFIADGSSAVLLGITRQLVGLRWAHAGRFQYAGSLGPVQLDAPGRQAVRDIGNCLAAAFDLRGLFGVDLILSRGQVWTVEVNPRFTASVEVLEPSLQQAAVLLHRHACRTGALPKVSWNTSRGMRGKVIVYSPTDFVVGRRFDTDCGMAMAAGQRAEFADIARPGTRISRGQPILTVLAGGPSRPAVLHRLRDLTRQVYRAIA